MLIPFLTIRPFFFRFIGQYTNPYTRICICAYIYIYIQFFIKTLAVPGARLCFSIVDQGPVPHLKNFSPGGVAVVRGQFIHHQDCGHDRFNLHPYIHTYILNLSDAYGVTKGMQAKSTAVENPDRKNQAITI